jgi:catechol 2,3-dioxygenase-like lactoylglutathione lyase family enzyme
MKPRLTVITLGVDDLERSLAFYRDGLGLPTRGIFGTEYEHGAVIFFELQNGLILAMWERRNLAWDVGIPQSPPSPTDLSLGYNVNSREEVDAVMEQARKAGAKITKPPEETFYGGYAGYFQDPDAHLWEVIWNPALVVPE